MLILDEKTLSTDKEIEEKYKNCKYLCIIDELDRIEDRIGYLYCVSTSEGTLEQLISERTKLQKEGRYCYIGGSYNNGGAIGIQYEYAG